MRFRKKDEPVLHSTGHWQRVQRTADDQVVREEAGTPEVDRLRERVADLEATLQRERRAHVRTADPEEARTKVGLMRTTPTEEYVIVQTPAGRLGVHHHGCTGGLVGAKPVTIPGTAAAPHVLADLVHDAHQHEATQHYPGAEHRERDQDQERGASYVAPPSPESVPKWDRYEVIPLKAGGAVVWCADCRTHETREVVSAEQYTTRFQWVVKAVEQHEAGYHAAKDADLSRRRRFPEVDWSGDTEPEPPGVPAEERD